MYYCGVTVYDYATQAMQGLALFDVVPVFAMARV